MMNLVRAIVGTTTALALSATGQASGTLPAALLGQWMTTTAGDTYYVTSGGQTNGPSGSGVTFTFTADGHYSEGAYYNVAMYKCNTGFFGFTEGTVTAANGKLTFKPLKASLRQWATCGGKDTKEDVSNDPNIMKTKVLDYRVTADGASPDWKVLTLLQANGQPYSTLRSKGTAQATSNVPSGGPGASGAVSGTLAVPDGQTVSGTVVFACPVKGGCDDTSKVKVAKVTSGGRTAQFRVEGLGEERYNLIAWKDLNGDGQYGPGDLAGGYTRDGEKVEAVAAPAQGLTISLSAVP
ncbi:hypothetical protein [Deinococcus apachensis]|uniref:hypothetical protein n=1 Tax=Deinococcus apachensis TaxID=309886 RepID=UPI0003752F17|nr:hypothetical protein [Deinococcus apachensis]